MAMRPTGRDVQHVARTCLDLVAVETVTQTASQHENRMTRFTPTRLGCARRIGRPFLVAEGDPELRDGLPRGKPVGDGPQGMRRGREQVGAVAHAVILPRRRPAVKPARPGRPPTTMARAPGIPMPVVHWGARPGQGSATRPLPQADEA